MSDSGSAIVVIIGAGFSGAMVAAHLLRGAPPAPLRVVVINRSGPLARGVAYGTRSSRHVLNVPAGRMSAFDDDPEHFLRFARTRLSDVTGGSFVPRGVYGDYLTWIMSEAAASSHTASLEQLTDEAIAIETSEFQPALRVRLLSGAVIEADRAVLAVGNYTPSHPALPSSAVFGSPGYIRDPWAAGALDAVPGDAPVLLIGSGLTMLDVALDLAGRGRTAPLVALSRRGLLPHPHRSPGAPPSYAHLPPALVACEPTAVAYLRATRRHIRRLAPAGIDWRDVIASLRPITPRLWEALSTREKSRFMRHLRPYWDVHRHRVAPELYEGFDALRREGVISLCAGRITALETTDGGAIRSTIRPRGSSRASVRDFGAVINCTGPEGNVRALDDPLISRLIGDGLVRPDPLGLGLDVNDSLALLRADGTPHPALALVGPLLRGRFWEATAVPELRQHAAQVASRLRAELTDPLSTGTQGP